MNQFLYNLEVVVIEPILWSALLVFVPVNFFSHQEILFILNTIVFDNNCFTIWLVVFLVESGGLKTDLSLLSMSIDFINFISRLRLTAVVDFLSLLRIENVWPHPCKLSIAHNVEGISRVICVSSRESMGFPASASAKHLLFIFVFKNTEAVSSFWVFDVVSIAIPLNFC